MSRFIKACCIFCKQEKRADKIDYHYENKCYHGLNTEIKDRILNRLHRSHKANYTPLSKEEYSKVRSDAIRKYIKSDEYNPNQNGPGTSGMHGRCRIYEHKEMKLRGSWELQTAKSLDAVGIEYTNKITPFDYVYNGKEHLYFPDFYLPEFDFYIEVKGRETDRDHAKWRVVNNLIVLRNPEIKRLKSGESIIDVANLNMM